MSARASVTRFTLTLISCAVLAACANQPARPLPTPAVVTALPETPTPVPAPVAESPAANQPWSEIAASDAVHGCEDSPEVLAAAKAYTRSPARFEAQLRQSLPLLTYVHEQLQANGIPAEFTMLPMVESSYQMRAIQRRNGPTGMWQFMPTTARLHGIVVNREYDGRFDPVASTAAAVRMLKSLDRQFGDWRLVDIAYNAGPLVVQNALRGRTDAGAGALPDIRVSATNRTHLVRLIALNCILRDPERFDVELPPAKPADRLVAVELPAGTPFDDAAAMAGIAESALRALNPGYLGARIPADSPRKLLMPAGAAETLAAARSLRASERLAQVDAATAAGDDPGAIPLPAEPAPPPAGPAAAAPPAPAAPARARRHRVRAGETLWSIAQRYHVSVTDLQRWNDLRGATLRAGEELRVRG